MAEYFDGDTLFVTPGDMDEQKYVTQTARTLSQSGVDTIKKVVIDRGIVVSCIGWQMGKSAIVRQPAASNQQINSIIVDESKVDLDFLYYVLKSKREEIFQLGATATRTPIVKKSLFESISFSAPTLPTQQLISSHLSALDDKIELNRQMNATLESMAQTLFKSWFVDFDPVIDNALAAGNAIPEPLRKRAETRKAPCDKRKTLPEEIQKQFPSSFVFSEEMGWVPEGWDVEQIGRIVSQRKEKSKNKEVTVLSATAIGELVPSDEHFNKQVYSKSTEKYLLVKEWDFAYNPSRINIGSVGMHKESYLGAVSPVYVVATPIFEYRWYLEFYIRSKRFHKWVETLASGSVRQSLSFNDFSSIPCIIPTKYAVTQFNLIYEKWRKKINANLEQSVSLADIRDSLLPHLLSRQLRIPDAEGLAEQVAAG